MLNDYKIHQKVLIYILFVFVIILNDEFSHLVVAVDPYLDNGRAKELDSGAIGGGVDRLYGDPYHFGSNSKVREDIGRDGDG